MSCLSLAAFAAARGLSLVAVGRFLIAVSRFLVAVATLVAEQGL